MSTTITESGANKFKQEWSEIAGEEVEIQAESLQEPIYAFGSELACLRLAYAFKHSGDRVTAEYSEGMKSWYFCLRPSA